MLPEPVKCAVALVVLVWGIILIYRQHRARKQAWWLKRYNFREAKRREGDRSWNS